MTSNRFVIAVSLLFTASFGTGLDADATDGVFLSTGNRIVVKTEGRNDYKPRIVNCSQSQIGLCIRDTDGQPPNNPLERHADGLTVSLPSWKIAYIIHPDGTGRTFLDGKEVKPFTWTMVPE